MSGDRYRSKRHCVVRWTPMSGDRYRSKGHCVQSGDHQCQETGTEVRDIAYSQVITNGRRQVQK